MGATKSWCRSISRLMLITLLGLTFLWYAALPRVHVYYSSVAQGQLDFVWDTNNVVYRGEISPGGVTADTGDVFPDENFFMILFWTALERNHCIMVNPKWFTTNIYIGPDGTIDRSPGGGTDVDRLSPCVEDY